MVVTGAALLLLAASAVASAASRMETGEATPVRGRVHLDFTIVIPPFLSVSRAGPDEGAGDDSTALPAARPGGADTAARDGFLVTANAGTLAHDPTGAARAESRGGQTVLPAADGAIPHRYSVALP